MKNQSENRGPPVKRSDHPAFSPVEEWKSALMTLPDNSFFELLRSVFGNIKTPFNKQRLLEDLFILLSRNEIRKVIAAYINDRDHKLIAALASLDKPVTSDLENFFAGEFSAAEFHSLLINLEERLIVYRFRDEGGLRLALNPVLEPILAPLIADTRPLFPSFPNESSSPQISGFPDDPRIMAALLVFLFNTEEVFRAETGPGFRGIRRKILDEGKKILPSLDLEQAVMVLVTLGLFKAEDQRLIPCRERIADFCELSLKERQGYWAAGVYICLYEFDADAYNGNYSLYRLRELASFINRFRLLLDPGKKYPETTLKRFTELMGKNVRGTGSGWSSLLYDDRVKIQFDSLLAVLEKTGLLEKTGTCWAAIMFAKPHPEKEKEPKPFIVMDTAFSFILYPEISFEDVFELTAFCSVKENNETAVRFELTRQSVVRGFDQGIGAGAMIELLDRLSLNRADANLAWTLREWENRYAGVSLHQGIILSLAEDLRYLAEAKHVASLIRRTLAPGVYLLSSGERAEAVAALLKAGVDIVAQPPLTPGAGNDRFKTGGFSRSGFPRLGFSGNAESLSDAFFPGLNSEEGTASGTASKETKSEEAESIREKFRMTLEKMRLPKPERDELAARIERRLVLSETQLQGTSLRYEKLEARGLDYAGKSIIAKQAIESGSLVEVSWPGTGGIVNNIVGKPESLEKKDGDSILVIRNSKDDTAGAASSQTIRIPLGKISLLRRIKQSIFGE